MNKDELLQLAINVATKAHKDQVDKAGKPYILHPITVANSVEDIDAKIVAYLHDVIEDTSITADDLRNLGFPEHLVQSILILTKNKGISYEEYITKIKTDPIACKVKIADLKHNMDLTRISNPTQKDYERVKKYKKALQNLEG